MHELHGGLDLLDREILDVNGDPVGKVDDVELAHAGDAPPAIEALLLGPNAYGRRLGHRLGRWIERAGTTLAGTADPVRIPMTMVADIDVSIRLSVSIDSLQRPRRTEEWVGDRFINRIPGARRASE